MDVRPWPPLARWAFAWARDHQPPLRLAIPLWLNEATVAVPTGCDAGRNLAPDTSAPGQGDRAKTSPLGDHHADPATPGRGVGQSLGSSGGGSGTRAARRAAPAEGRSHVVR